MDKDDPPPTPSGSQQPQKVVQRKRLEPSEKEVKKQSSGSQSSRQKSFSNSSTTIMAGLYDLEETLGKGHFATVKAAKHVFTGEKVAVKVIDKTKLDSVSQKALLKEVLCMKLVQHPNVVKLYEVIDTSTKMYLVLELGQGDLYDLILRQQGGLQEQDARTYFTQILTAVSYCHKLHVAHRDLKPENVVFFPPNKQTRSSSTLGQVKLTDFGFSNKFCPGVNLDTSCGSLAYSAPEILLGDSYDAPLVDIWSLGVILYMLVCGRAPFQEANDSETLTMIMDVKYSLPDHLSFGLKDLIRRMLVRDPRRRITLGEIETHEWVTCGGNEVGGAVPLIVNERLSEVESERIFSEMVKGGVVSCVEEVKSALRSSAYNHLTSTYYLLAERYLREKARSRIRTPTAETPTTSPTTPQPQTPSNPNTPAITPPSSPPKPRVRKNSHVLEDIVLPSSIENPRPQVKPNETQSIAGLDLETSNTRKNFVTLPSIDQERSPSPHHQHYYHHVPRRTQKKNSPEEPSQSPPRYCNPRPRINKSNATNSDSSDEGTPGPSCSSTHPTITLTLTEEKPTSSCNDSPNSNSSGNQHLVVNNNNLKGAESYEAIDEGKKVKKKRILFLSWFFKKSGGEGKGKSSRNIYKTKSCSHLQKTACNVELDTRECFGVCNGKVG